MTGWAATVQQLKVLRHVRIEDSVSTIHTNAIFEALKRRKPFESLTLKDVTLYGLDYYEIAQIFRKNKVLNKFKAVGNIFSYEKFDKNKKLQNNSYGKFPGRQDLTLFEYILGSKIQTLHLDLRNNDHLFSHLDPEFKN